MYSRRSLRNQQPKPSVPHSSSMGAALWGGPVSSGQQQQQPSTAADYAPYEITGARTMPGPHAGGQEEMERSRSGNLLFRRNRSIENQKEEESRTRAQELGKRLELSGNRDLSLNKSANFAYSQEVRGTPSLGANMMNSAQAMALIADANKQKNQQAQNNVLLTEHERNQSKAEMMKIQASASSGWEGSPVEVQGANSDHYKDTALNEALTFETVSSTSSAGTGVDVVLSPTNEPVVLEPQDNSFSSKQKFHAYPEAHPQKKMTRTEKKIELARQARINKQQRKGAIPELC